MSTTTSWALSARARTAINSPLSGHGVAEFAYDAEWTSGTGDNQADKVGSKVQTVPNGGNVDVDLRAFTDANGAALNGAELAALIVEVPVGASGAITVKRSSSERSTLPRRDHGRPHAERRIPCPPRLP